jgi:hypothetical protein
LADVPHFGPFGVNWVGIWVGDFFDAEGISSLGSCQQGEQSLRTSRSRIGLDLGDGSKRRRPAWESSFRLKTQDNRAQAVNITKSATPEIP